jgi:hypothetical protein
MKSTGGTEVVGSYTSIRPVLPSGSFSIEIAHCKDVAKPLSAMQPSTSAISELTNCEETAKLLTAMQHSTFAVREIFLAKASRRINCNAVCDFL